MRSEADMGWGHYVMALAMGLASGTTGCFTFVGAEVGRTFPKHVAVSRSDVERDVAKAKAPEVDLYLTRAPMPEPTGILDGAFVGRGPGVLFIRNERGTWRIRLETIQRIEMRESSTWREVGIEELEWSERTEPAVRIAWGRITWEGLFRRSDLPGGTSFVLQGRIVALASDELRLRRDGVYFTIPERTVERIEVTGASHWLEGALVGASVDALLIVASYFAVKDLPVDLRFDLK